MVVAGIYVTNHKGAQKPVLDDVNRGNKCFVVIEDIPTISERSLYYGMDLVGKNAHVILHSNVSLYNYHEEHPDDPKTANMCSSWQQVVCIIDLGLCLRDIISVRSEKHCEAKLIRK